MGQCEPQLAGTVDQVQVGTVINRILGRRLLLHHTISDAVASCHLGYCLRCAGNAKNAVVKISGIGLQTLRGITLRINTDEDHLYLVPFPCRQLIQGEGQHSQPGGADIRTPSVAKVEYHQTTAVIRQRYRAAVRIEHKITTLGR